MIRLKHQRNTMKTIRYIFLLSIVVFLSSCQDILDVEPQGILSDNLLNSPDEIESLIISAYAYMGNDHYTVPNVLWPYGDLRAGDAYKGGQGTADISAYTAMEIFSTITPDMSSHTPTVLGDLNNKKWARQYVGISRVNNALRRVNAISVEDYPIKYQRRAELTFLRAHYYFDLKILYKNIPWFDENATGSEIEMISNTEYSNDELWEKIAEDLRYSVENLSPSVEDIGRPNKYTAMAYLAKVRLYQAYKQDEMHNVTEIDKTKLQEVVNLTDTIIAKSSFNMESDFAFPFLWEHENGHEAVWQIQRSRDDGTTTGNLDFSAMLSYPMSQEFGCCGFHVPSQNLANAFKTDLNGLPLFESYNNEDLVPENDFVDPRIDHTIAMPGKPWKYEPELICDESWASAPDIYGTYFSLKETESPNCDCFEYMTPFMSSSKNSILIRYTDVLLWRAEALIELDRYNEALTIINDIRQRAANSTTMLVDNSGTLISNYHIGLYGSFPSKEFARKALRWERRLELALEGHRFFDLVRWGEAKETLDTYFITEKIKREYLQWASFEKNKHEYLPIPKRQIDLSQGLYEQNYGY